MYIFVIFAKARDRLFLVGKIAGNVRGQNTCLK